MMQMVVLESESKMLPSRLREQFLQRNLELRRLSDQAVMTLLRDDEQELVDTFVAYERACDNLAVAANAIVDEILRRRALRQSRLRKAQHVPATEKAE